MILNTTNIEIYIYLQKKELLHFYTMGGWTGRAQPGLNRLSSETGSEQPWIRKSPLFGSDPFLNPGVIFSSCPSPLNVVVVLWLKNTASDIAAVLLGIRTSSSSSLDDPSSCSVMPLSPPPDSAAATSSGSAFWVCRWFVLKLFWVSSGCEGAAAVSRVSGKQVVDGLFRVLPARELRCAGFACLCSPVYVTTKIPGSDKLRSTCFLAKHPLQLLHL